MHRANQENVDEERAYYGTMAEMPRKGSTPFAQGASLNVLQMIGALIVGILLGIGLLHHVWSSQGEGAVSEKAAKPVVSLPTVLPAASPAGSPWKQVTMYTGLTESLGTPLQLHSKAGQDWIVPSILGCKKNGFFVDLAAADPIVDSNTLMLERDFGWSGLCVEPNTKYSIGLAKRKCNVVGAVVGSPSDTEVTFSMRDFLGGIVGEGLENKVASGELVKLKTVSLAELLDHQQAPHIIDYLSLDVEGAESLVFKDFPWNKYKIMTITVERPKQDLREALALNGYVQIRSVENGNGNAVWVHSSVVTSPDQLQKLIMNYMVPAQLKETCMKSLGYEFPSNLQ